MFCKSGPRSTYQSGHNLTTRWWESLCSASYAAVNTTLYSHLLLWIWIERRPRLLQTRRAAIDRYRPRSPQQQTRRTLPQRANGTERQTDTVPLHRPCLNLCEHWLTDWLTGWMSLLWHLTTGDEITMHVNNINDIICTIKNDSLQ